MKMTRRRLAGAGAVVLAISGLLPNTAGALADSGEDAAVEQAVEALRKALLAADKGQIEKLTARQLSYGHSDGKVQNKA